MRYFQNFDKIDSFLKPTLSLGSFHSRQLNRRVGDGVTKEGIGILHQIYRFMGVLKVGGVGFIKVRIGII